MTAEGFLGTVAVAAIVITVMRDSYRDAARARRATAGTLTARELAGLVNVDYTPDLVLVTPRNVELPYSPDWSLDDVMDTLVEIDAL